jgi:hypothetical protein
MTDSEEMNWSDYNVILGTLQRKKERGKRKGFYVTPTCQGKMIDSE